MIVGASNAAPWLTCSVTVVQRLATMLAQQTGLHESRSMHQGVAHVFGLSPVELHCPLQLNRQRYGVV